MMKPMVSSTPINRGGGMSLWSPGARRAKGSAAMQGGLPCLAIGVRSGGITRLWVAWGAIEC